MMRFLNSVLLIVTGENSMDTPRTGCNGDMKPASGGVKGAAGTMNPGRVTRDQSSLSPRTLAMFPYRMFGSASCRNGMARKSSTACFRGI